VSANSVLNFDVCLFENLYLPSQSECIVSAKVNLNLRNNEGVFYPFKLKLSKFGVVIAQSVCYCLDGSIPVKIVNLNDNSITLYKNTKIGEFETSSPVTSKSNSLNTLTVVEPSDSLLETFYQKIDNQSHLSSKEKKNALDLLKSYSSIFSENKTDIGYCKLVQHEIELKQNAPVQQMNGTVPLHIENWVDNQVENLKKMGVIRNSNSPWSAPVVVVKKKNGDFRMCIDFRRLNSVTVKPMYRIPDNQSLFNHLAGATMFSTIDVSNAYYQCEMRESDKKLTAFTTRKGQFEFNRMPFGLSGAPFTFQRLMHTILREENWLLCLVYLDDILIFSKDFDEHIERIKIIFEKIKQSGLKLAPSKCNFFLPEVSFLGHIVSKNGLHTDPSKISALKDWPFPSTVAEMRQFLGFVNYYRKFVKSFADYTNLLEEILTTSCKSGSKKNDSTLLVWNKEGKDAFVKLKDVLCSAPCLSFPQINNTFILDTDASHSAIGGVLSQIQDGKEFVIAYGSRKLTKSEKSYCITRKELLSVYYFVTHYKQFLLGARFIIRTDHKALKWLLNWDSPNTSQYCSWIAELEIYDFEIQHRSGEKHTNADFFSRPFEACQQCELKHEDPKRKRNVKVYALSENKESEEDIKNLHSNLGHVGITKMLSYFQELGNCSSRTNDLIKKVVENCWFCAQRKVVHYNKGNKRFSALSLFNTITMDVAGPLPMTKLGNMFLLSIVDVYSRYICLYPIKNLHSQTIISVLKRHWFPSFGSPKVIVCDGGSYFSSLEMTNFLKYHGVEQHITSPYHPNSNGLIERNFFSVKDMIFCCSQEKGKEWDEVLHIVETGLRSTKNRNTGYSPFHILYGFTPKVSKWVSSRTIEEIDKRRESIYKDLKNINNQLAHKNEKIKHRFNVGDRVMIRVADKKPGVYSKRFDGPGEIVQLRKNKSYLIRIKNKIIVRHEDHIKFVKSTSSFNHSSITSIESTKRSNNKYRLNQEEGRYPERQRQQTIRYGYDL